MGEHIRFDEIFEKDLVKKIHDRFKEHIKERKDGVFFPDILKNETIKASELLTINVKFAELDIHMTETELAKFFEANCYMMVFPKMLKDGHEFSKTEKAFLAGYSMFQDCQHDKGYPYDFVDEQVKELHEQTSPEFINTSFQWMLDSLVKVYDYEFNQPEHPVQS